MKSRITTSMPLCINFAVEVVGFLESSSICIVFVVDLDVDVVGFLESSSATQKFGLLRWPSATAI